MIQVFYDITKCLNGTIIVSVLVLLFHPRMKVSRIRSLSRSAECIDGVVIVHHYPLSLGIYWLLLIRGLSESLALQRSSPSWCEYFFFFTINKPLNGRTLITVNHDTWKKGNKITYNYIYFKTHTGSVIRNIRLVDLSYHSHENPTGITRCLLSA